MFHKFKFFNEFFYIYNFFILKNQTKSRIWLYDFLLNLTQPKADPTGSDRIRIRHPDMYTLLYTVQCVLCMFNVSHQLSHRVLPRNKVQNNQAKREMASESDSSASTGLTSTIYQFHNVKHSMFRVGTKRFVLVFSRNPYSSQVSLSGLLIFSSWKASLIFCPRLSHLVTFCPQYIQYTTPHILPLRSPPF